tara:strand:- start:2566 stop:2862 length:297 start_codon:yes stop_codon:yes gene_type:complete
LKNVNNEGWKPYKLYDVNNPTYFNKGHISWDYYPFAWWLKKKSYIQIFYSYRDQGVHKIANITLIVQKNKDLYNGFMGWDYHFIDKTEWFPPIKFNRI